MKRQIGPRIGVFVILTIAFAIGLPDDKSTSSVTPESTEGSRITREFFGFDLATQDVRLRREVLSLMNEDAVGWEKIEPNPPRQGVHAYDWSALDEWMRAVVESGRVVDFTVKCRSDWATVVPYRNMNEECCDMSPPKEDADSDVAAWGMTAYQAWGDFVFNLVERYDGDGINDAAGITRPAIKYLNLGAEIEAYGGTPELYVRMLAVTYEAAKRAEPGILVVRGRTNPGNIIDDDPDEATLSRRLALFQSFMNFISITLRLGKEHFDIYAINFNDHYTGLFPFVRLVKAEMAKNGYTKPFLVGDARTTLYPRDMVLWVDAGLFDRRVYEATGDLRKARKPVYYAAKQLIDALLSADREVKILDLGKNVFAYQVLKEGKKLFFLWHEDPFDVDAQGLVRRQQRVMVDLTPFVSTSQVRVKYFVTELDANYAPIYPAEVITSADKVTIDETPVLVTEEP